MSLDVFLRRPDPWFLGGITQAGAALAATLSRLMVENSRPVDVAVFLSSTFSLTMVRVQAFSTSDNCLKSMMKNMEKNVGAEKKVVENA